jgi:3-dehydroquinate synthetase
MRFAALLGMIYKERASESGFVGTSPEFAQAQADLLDALHLPRLDFVPNPQDVLDAMKHDKKTRGGHVRFVLLSDVGQWETINVDDQLILEALERFYK